MQRSVMIAVAMVAWCAVAEVPTQTEFTAAENVIADLLEPQMAAMKSGKKKTVEVADYAMSLVGESDTAAAKFLLARRACNPGDFPTIVTDANPYVFASKNVESARDVINIEADLWNVDIALASEAVFSLGEVKNVLLGSVG